MCFLDGDVQVLVRVAESRRWPLFIDVKRRALSIWLDSYIRSEMRVTDHVLHISNRSFVKVQGGASLSSRTVAIRLTIKIVSPMHGLMVIFLQVWIIE